jgi:hypothetical protein
MSNPEDRTALARQVLVDILRVNGPQLGSKLKIKLIAGLIQRGRLTPAESTLLIPKLSTFLVANSDLVEVQKSTVGDITIALRDKAAINADQETDAQPIRYRPDVWQAFLNPDPQRRRFFHRHAHTLVHYLIDSMTSPNPEIARQVDRTFWNR